MSRKGKQPIALPKGVEVKVNKDQLHVKGPKGALQREIPSGLQLNVENGQLFVTVDGALAGNNRLHGLYQSLIQNMVVGASQGFEVKLEFIGVGYRAILKGKLVEIQVGHSHPVEVAIPDTLQVKVDKNLLTVSGIDKQKVGQLAASIRAIKPPEPYQGKGIRYVGEYVRKKAGKTAAKTAG